MRRRRLLVILLLLGLALCLASGCKCNTEAASVPPKTPTLRLYVISTLAGALEPCGCVKDMLGGVDHAAAFMRSQAEHAPESAALGAGPMFFMNAEPDPKRATQDGFKAEALAASLKEMGLKAWAPGANDWSAGAAKLKELGAKAGASVLAANLTDGPTVPTRVFELGGVKVGVAGVSWFSHKTPQGLTASEPKFAAEKARVALQAQGAKVLVLLAAMERGDALRLAEVVPGYHVLIIGKPFDQGDGNDPPTTPMMVGKTLAVETPNHLQSFGVIDFFVRNDSYDFADGSNLREVEEAQALQYRIHELESRISYGERFIADGTDKNPAASKQDITARKIELERLKKELAARSVSKVPPRGSFFTYKDVEVREKLGSEPRVAARMSEFYRQVNDHNREAFKDWTPPPLPEGQSGYVGIERCTTCHQEERAFWNGTAHAGAYKTLSSQHKEFNLDCVSCHVTGYAKAGGSTVTHVEGLRDVQCEVCHGPGSRHTQNPADPSLISKTPARRACAECHHTPHVKPDWSVDESWKKIIGPGHGG